VSLHQGNSIRQAAAGLERLLLSDAERVAHCDASALLVGYLLGLPCFCFRPDVVEAVKLLRESVDSLDAYQQPAASRRRNRPVTGSSSSSKVNFLKMFQGGEGGSTRGDDRKDKRSVKDQEKDQLSIQRGGLSMTHYHLTSSVLMMISACTDVSSVDYVLSSVDLDADLSVYTDTTTEGLEERRLLRLGRLLVWLIAPVAAETMRYGDDT